MSDAGARLSTNASTNASTKASTKASTEAPATHDAMARHATRGAIAMLFARGFGAVVAICAAAILARHITPDEYGLVAMALAAIALGRAFEEIGLGDATVQRERVTDAQVSALFWLNALVGVVLTIAFALCAPLIARFYARDDLTPIALALSPIFLLAALGAQPRAVMRRNFRFRALAIAQGASLAIGAIAGISAALAGAGAWALVTQSLVQATALCIGAWLGACIGCRWSPRRPARADGLAPLVRFGLHVTATQLLTRFSRNVDNILIGRFIGPIALGLYDRAFQLMSLPATQFNQPISNAVIPALSRLQNDPDAFRRLYRSGAEVVASVAFPIAVFSAAAAPAIIGTVLGPNWLDAAPLLRALAPTGLMVSLNIGTAWAYQSLGRSGRQLRWSLFGTAVTTVAIVAGLPWGALGVAIAVSVARVSLRPFAVAYCFRDTFLRPSDLFESAWRPATAAIIAGFASYAVEFTLDAHAFAAPIMLALQGVVFLLVGVGALAAIPGGFARIRAARAQIASMRSDQRAARAKTANTAQNFIAAGAHDPPLSILLVVGSFPLASETFIRAHALDLVRAGHRVEILALREGNCPWSEEEIASGVPSRVRRAGFDAPVATRLALAPARLLRLLVRSPSAAIHALRRFRSTDIPAGGLLGIFDAMESTRRFDAIHAEFGPMGRVALEAREAGLIAGPLVVAFYGYDAVREPRRRGRDVYARLFREAALLLPNSNYLGERLAELGAPHDRIVTQHLGIDPHAFRPRDAGAGDTDAGHATDVPKHETAAPVTALLVGRLVEKKGFEFAIRALARLETDSPVRLRIVGDGPLRAELEALAGELGVAERVAFLGWRTNDEVAREMRAAELLLVPSVTAADGDIEGMPVVALEAMATGLPVIGSAHSGIPEVVADGRTGFVVAERDSAGIARALEELCNPALRRTLGSAGRQRVEGPFARSALTERWVSLLRKVQ